MQRTTLSFVLFQPCKCNSDLEHHEIRKPVCTLFLYLFTFLWKTCLPFFTVRTPLQPCKTTLCFSLFINYTSRFLFTLSFTHLELDLELSNYIHGFCCDHSLNGATKGSCIWHFKHQSLCWIQRSLSHPFHLLLPHRTPWWCCWRACSFNPSHWLLPPHFRWPSNPRQSRARTRQGLCPMGFLHGNFLIFFLLPQKQFITTFSFLFSHEVLGQVSFGCVTGQLTNHGISENLMEEVMNKSHEFHNLPLEEKKEFSDKGPLTPIRHGTSFHPRAEKVHYWRDYLKVTTLPEFNFPHKPPGYKYVQHNYPISQFSSSFLYLQWISHAIVQPLTNALS